MILEKSLNLEFIMPRHWMMMIFIVIMTLYLLYLPLTWNLELTKILNFLSHIPTWISSMKELSINFLFLRRTVLVLEPLQIPFLLVFLNLQ